MMGHQFDFDLFSTMGMIFYVVPALILTGIFWGLGRLIPPKKINVRGASGIGGAMVFFMFGLALESSYLFLNALSTWQSFQVLLAHDALTSQEISYFAGTAVIHFAPFLTLFLLTFGRCPWSLGVALVLLVMSLLARAWIFASVSAWTLHTTSFVIFSIALIIYYYCSKRARYTFGFGV